MARTERQPQERDPYSQVAWADRAVVLVDVAESVRLIEQDETGFISRWLALVERVKTIILPVHGGRLVKSLGDGMLLDFSDARAAVSAAFAIQAACHECNIASPPEQHIYLRMGIEAGDVIVDRDDVYGRGVNRAARLFTLAHPGEIVMSANVRGQITADLDADIVDLGDCYLKHVAQPVRAYRIRPPGPTPSRDPVPSTGDLLPTIAVVPFMTRDPSDDYHVLGEVLAEELIRDLSRSAELYVISRLSTTVFRGRSVSLQQISEKLNANYVLSGEYRVNNRRVTVEAELADGRSGQIVWSKRHTAQIAGVLSGRRELTNQIAADVSSAVITSELRRAQSNALPTLTSYTLLMGAVALMHRLSSRDFDEAHRLLEALIERAPRRALPQAWLANWHVLRVQQGWSPDQRQDAQLALRCTGQALDADPQCSLALAVDGFVHTNLLKQLETAKERYDLALLSNPNDALAWALKGTLHAFMGEGASAVACTRRALRLSPLDPHRYFYESLAASAHIAARQYEAALHCAQRSLRANRNHTSTLRVIAVSQWHLGQEEEARRTARELLRLEPTLTVSGWLERSPSAPFSVGQEFARVLKLVGVPD